MTARRELQAQFGEFLRARRMECTPEQVGLPAVGMPRRVTGLRREEVAHLAKMSADYYTRLEQGRLPPPSDDVLEAIAGALQLDDDQRAYMRELAHRSQERSVKMLPPERVTKRTQVMLDCMTGAPAMALGRVMDVLAWNELAASFFVDFATLRRSERNLVRLLFLDQRIRSLYTDWQDAARVAAAMLRIRAARYPHDERLCDSSTRSRRSMRTSAAGGALTT
jgi:transcriptional regulator with XRE-family HTH domain